MNRNTDHLMETYRGFDIYYDEDKDKFVCEMVMEDDFKTSTRSSLTALKREVDKFLKANANFKSFKVMVISSGYGDEDKKSFDGDLITATAIGVRKDGALIIEKDNDGKNKSYIKYEPGNSYRARECRGIRVYNPKLFEIEKEWKENENIWEAKQEELIKKAKPFINTIDWEYVKSFKATE